MDAAGGGGSGNRDDNGTDRPYQRSFLPGGQVKKQSGRRGGTGAFHLRTDRAAPSRKTGIYLGTRERDNGADFTAALNSGIKEFLQLHNRMYIFLKYSSINLLL